MKKKERSIPWQRVACTMLAVSKQREKPKLSPKSSWVYAIQSYQQDGSLGPIKIGVSHAPGSRIRALQTGSPCRLELIAVIKGGYQLEQEVHRRFAATNIQGEWFTPTAELLAFLQETFQ